MANDSYQATDTYGNVVYVVTKLYTSPNGNTLLARSDVHLSAGSGWVLAGGYSPLSIYACTCWGTPWSGVDILYYPDSNATTFANYVPLSTVTGGSAGTWGLTISSTTSLFGSGAQVGGDISWTANMPQFAESPFVQTSNMGGWKYTDNDGINGNAPTAVGFSAGTAQSVVHNAYNWVYWEGIGEFEYVDPSTWWVSYVQVYAYGYLAVYLT